MRAVILSLVAAAGTACATAAEPEPGPEAFADVAEAAPGVVLEMRYAGEENFTGRPVPGYNAARCLMTKEAAAALAGVQEELAGMWLSLRIYDCYRPQTAVDSFVAWAADENDTLRKADYYPNLPKAELFPRGYIAAKSGHSRGSTLDLTIDGLDMGSPYDRFDEISHTVTTLVDAPARANRLLLKLVMEKHGFKNYDQEWWHYTLVGEPYPDTYFDFPVE
jgi:D-alanyl-D-alanine dipeptidase